MRSEDRRALPSGARAFVTLFHKALQLVDDATPLQLFFDTATEARGWIAERRRTLASTA